MKKLVVTLMYIALGLLLVLIMQSVAISQEGTLEKGEITSPALEGNLLGDPATRSFYVYLPPSYETSEKRYPAFYMLHGTWETAESHTGMRHTIDRMIRNGEIGEMIAVFVDANNRLHASYYFNSVTLGDYETYITKDLVNYVDGHYRTIPHRSSRGITGFSMGGYGAMHLALKFPDIFGAVVAQGGVYDMATFAIPQMLTHEDARGWYAAVLPNPDNPPDFFDLPYKLVNDQVQIIPELYQKCVEPDVMYDLDRYLKQPVRLKGIKIVHGKADGAIPISQARKLDKKLTDLGIDHVYVEHNGGHDFMAEESLSFLSDYLLFATAVHEVRMK